MDLIWDGIREALRPIFTGNGEVYEIVLLSLTVSGAATGIALIIGLGMASLLAFRPPPGRTLVLSFLNSGMALPPVVVGLVVAVMLWRTGPLGQLPLLYPPAAIVVAQAVIATPVVTALSAAALQTLHPKLRLQVLALGASRWQAASLLVRGARCGWSAPAAPSSRSRSWTSSPARCWPSSGPTGRARARSSACWRCWSGRPPARACSTARPAAAGPPARRAGGACGGGGGGPASNRGPAAPPTPSPAARRSGPAWPAPLPWSRRCCSSTSPSPPWTHQPPYPY